MSFVAVSKEYLSRLGVAYECIQHAPVKSAYDIAEKANIPLSQLAISVLLADEQGSMLVTLPAQQGLDFEALNLQLNRQASLAPSGHYRTHLKSFPATLLPPWHHLYRLPLIVEQALCEEECVYLPSGSDTVSFKLSQAEFQRLIQGSSRARFGRVPQHVLIKEAEEAEPAQQEQLAESARARLREKLDGGDDLDLPVLPELASELLALKAREDRDPVDVAQVIEQDPVLSGLILSYAGSALFAYQGKLASVKEAIYHVLGVDTALDIAIGAAVGRAFEGERDGPLGLRRLWHEALFSAALVQQLAARMPRGLRPHMGTAYLAGLFHNIGYLLLASRFPGEYALFNSVLSNDPEACLLEVEAKALEVPHTELGLELLRQWRLAPVFQVTAAHHHDPGYTGEHALYVHLCQIADSLMKGQGMGDAHTAEIDGRLLQQYNLIEDDLAEALDAVLQVGEVLEVMAGRIAA